MLSRISSILALLILVHCQKTAHTISKNKKLYIGGIFPMAGSWAGGKGCRPAVDMALEDINKRHDILRGFELKMIANDSRCMPGLAMKVLYELLYNEPIKLMILGPGCSVESTFVGQAARTWNLIVLSYGSSSPALSSRTRFPTFFRTHPSATLHNPTRIKLFKKFGWTRIGVIHETQEVFTSTMEDLEERASQNGIEIVARTNFLVDPENAVRNLKKQDARIIVGLFYEDKARRVFCEVYKQKLYGPKYLWFIIGWYADNWYMEPDTNCTVAQMEEALQGHFTTEGLMRSPYLKQQIISGETAEDVLRKIDERIRMSSNTSILLVPGYMEAPLAYDAVWALALALNRAQMRLQKRGLSLENFDYTNNEVAKEIYIAMNSTNFMGVSGRVAFNEKGDRIAMTQIEQMINGNYTVIGFYDIGSDDLQWNDREVWIDNHIPQDRTIIKNLTRVISTPLYVGLCTASSLGILCSIGLLYFNHHYRDRRIIQMSQRNVNNLMLIGCITCFGCIFVNGLDARLIDRNTLRIVCQIRVWLLCGGFSLSYGALFSKIWAIYRLTTRWKIEIKVVKETETYMIVGACLLADVIVLVMWQIIDPFHIVLENFPHERSQSSDVEILPQLEHCSSELFNVWFGIIVGVKGILLLFGILLAYETRNIKVTNINDLRFVGLSVYNVVVLCVITAPVTWVISSHQDTTFAFVSTAILLSNFLTMGFIFIPKALHVKNFPRDVDDDHQTDSQSDEENHKKLLQENEELKRLIKEKEERIKQLKRQLQARLDSFHISNKSFDVASNFKSSTKQWDHIDCKHNLKKRRATVGSPITSESFCKSEHATTTCNGI